VEVDFAGDESLALDANETIGEQSLQPSASISSLRSKLHARIQSLQKSRQGAKADGEPGSKDELLEAQRQRRASLREKRRAENKKRKENKGGNSKVINCLPLSNGIVA